MTVSDPTGPTVDELMEIATRFYVLGESQTIIARSLGRDPSSISRYLRRARDLGVVSFVIRRPHEVVDEVGNALAERFGLQRAIVVRTFEDVGRAAAQFVASQLVNNMRVGLSWGRMLSSVVHNLPPGIVSNLDIALLHGGVGNIGTGSEGTELARELASLYKGSRVVYLHAPVLVDSADIKQAMLRDGSISAALKEAGTRELAIVGIGALDENAPLVRHRHLTARDRKALLRAGAVGDVGTRFFTAEGSSVGVLDERLMAVAWTELAAVPQLVAVAAGSEKTHAVLGAAKTGLVKTLITDEATAREVLLAADP